MQTASTVRSRPRPLTGLLLALAVAATAGAVHWPVLSAGAVSFDDNPYLFDNPTLMQPSWASAGRTFREVLEPSRVKGYYEPLTLVSLMLDVAAGGNRDNLRPFHRTSLALHVMNTALLVWLLYTLFGNAWAAAIAGLLFATHPLTVEPVAWVWERKTLLTTFFALWSLILYVRYAAAAGGWGLGAGEGRRVRLDAPSSSVLSPKSSVLGMRDQGSGVRGQELPGKARSARHSALSTQPSVLSPQHSVLFLCFSLVAFLLALLAKPTSVPLPLMLLILDWWPLRRFGRRALLEKAPFFVLAGVFAVITIVSTDRTGAVSTGGGPSMLTVPLRIAYLNVFYLGKTLWPAELSSVYTMPQPLTLSNGQVLAAVLASAGLVAVLLLSVRRTRALLAGWLFFFAAILPTLGILKYSWVNASDKYVYLPAIGLLLATAWGIDGAWSARGGHTILRAPLLLAGLLAATACAVGTRTYLTAWANTESLCRHMLSVSPNSMQARNNLANALVRRGAIEEAMEQYVLAINDNPAESFEARNNLANLLAQKGRLAEAREQYEQLLKVRPDLAAAHRNLANVHQMEGHYVEAVRHYREALRHLPDDPVTLGSLAWLLATRTIREDSTGPGPVELAQEACDLTGNADANLLDTLAAACANAGRFDDAITVARQAATRASQAGQAELSRQITDRLRLYEARRPYREPDTP